MYRVVIADDEKLARDRICRYVSQIEGVELVASFWNGQMVKEYLEHHVVNLVITDIRMPSMDGLELAQWIVNNRPECQIILVSAYEDFAYARKAIELGVKSYLTKPIRSEELVQMVQHLQQKRHEYELQNIYVRNMQAESLSRTTKQWLKQRDKKPPAELEMLKGCVVSVEDNRDFKGDRELLPVALNNILQWSARCISVFVGKMGWQYLFVLQSDQKDLTPQFGELEVQMVRLLGVAFQVEQVGCFSKVEDLPILLDGISNREMDALAPVLRYIENHLSDAVRRDEVAAVACMTPAYFSRYFKEKTGLSFQDYVQKLRMEEAKRLLQQGLPIREICERVGFQDRNYFNQSFRKYTGSTPAEYRQLFK